MTNVIAALGADACAAPVLATAKALADMLDATVVALHVEEDDAPSPEALANEAQVEFRHTRGTPLDQIVNAANDTDVAALVLGSRGASAGPRPAGATALEVITRTAKPVVLVPPDAHPPERFTRVLLPVEGTGASPPTLDAIIDAADRRKLDITVVHLHSPTTVPAFSDHEPHGTRVWDQEFLARHLPLKSNRVTVLRRLGTPADDVAALAGETGAELIVLVWSQSLAEGRARVVTRTLASTRIPVLLLPTEPSIHLDADSVHRPTTSKPPARMRPSTTNG
jgi:nucleotide-binding universal stress UspA family protein